MCGVIGIIYKNTKELGLAPVGGDLIKMLTALEHRGKDSTGVTISGLDTQEDYIIRCRVDNKKSSISDLLLQTISKLGAVIKYSSFEKGFGKICINYEGEISELANNITLIEEVKVDSIGTNSEIVKDIGNAASLNNSHLIRDIKGTHGIGHVRMATESKIDISHAHPFWAYPFPDISVVHNGQLTNYHTLRRKYQDMGYRFQTGNDSEIISVFLAERLASGLSLDKAINESLDVLDGTFTYLVSTADAIGYAKDRWSAKPLVIMETENRVAIASEETALRSVFEEEIDRFEPQEKECMTWLV
ncbi:MAG: glutamine amidotransferase [Chloroflexi bacterium]|nr:glutamine amidotransferase [Chloroflexota bacterium]MCH2308243.1 class II glutamine amidotransferase [SAR202 cluster bacterium]